MSCVTGKDAGAGALCPITKGTKTMTTDNILTIEARDALAKEARTAIKLGHKARRSQQIIGTALRDAGFTLENIKRGKSHAEAFEDLAVRSTVIGFDEAGEGARLSEKVIKLAKASAKEVPGDQIILRVKDKDGNTVERTKKYVQQQFGPTRKWLQRAIAGDAKGKGKGNKSALDQIKDRLVYIANRTKDENPVCDDVLATQAAINKLAACFGIEAFTFED